MSNLAAASRKAVIRNAKNGQRGILPGRHFHTVVQSDGHTLAARENDVLSVQRRFGVFHDKTSHKLVQL